MKDYCKNKLRGKTSVCTSVQNLFSTKDKSREDKKNKQYKNLCDSITSTTRVNMTEVGDKIKKTKK